MSELTWREFKLDTREDAYWRPFCSEEGCKNPAVLITGSYLNGDSMQGEFSQFRGWFFCQEHAAQFFERRKESEARG